MVDRRMPLPRHLLVTPADPAGATPAGPLAACFTIAAFPSSSLLARYGVFFRPAIPRNRPATPPTSFPSDQGPGSIAMQVSKRAGPRRKVSTTNRPAGAPTTAVSPVVLYLAATLAINSSRANARKAFDPPTRGTIFSSSGFRALHARRKAVSTMP
jgi:hypothetical protein